MKDVLTSAIGLTLLENSIAIGLEIREAEFPPQDHPSL
jgi:hypothetical protein